MKKILVIGQNSYLATGLIEKLNLFEVFSIDIPDFSRDIELIKSADIIINFAIQPEFSTQDFAEEEIIDIKIAKLIKDTQTRFFYISSRKIYGQSSELKFFKETDSPAPFDFYSKNKLLGENILNRILGERLCILRVSNILGEPILRQGYNTFMGWITREFVSKGKLSVTENLYAVKDFISKEYFHNTLAVLFRQNISGIINVASGINIPVGELLERYVGKDNILITEQKPIKEQFLLNVEKLHSIAPAVTKEELLQSCQKYNQILLALKEDCERGVR